MLSAGAEPASHFVRPATEHQRRHAVRPPGSAMYANSAFTHRPTAAGWLAGRAVPATPQSLLPVQRNQKYPINDAIINKV